MRYKKGRVIQIDFLVGFPITEVPHKSRSRTKDA